MRRRPRFFKLSAAARDPWLLIPLLLAQWACTAASVFAQAAPVKPAAAEPTAQAAPAQRAAAEPQGYREAVDAAVAAFEAHDVEEARSLFARADALYPNARTQRGLGLAEFELRNYVQSIKHLEAALASQVRPLDGPLRALTEQQLAKARTFVGQFVISAKPALTELRVDGFDTELPADGALMLRVGDHELELHTSAHLPERRRLKVKGGETETLHIIFAKSVNLVSGPTEQASPSRWYENPWLWVATGVVVVGAATAIAIAATSGPSEPNRGTTGIAFDLP